MIATLTGPGIAPHSAPVRVALPAAPVPGDVIEAPSLGIHVRVLDRRFVLPPDGESCCVLRVERVEG